MSEPSIVALILVVIAILIGVGLSGLVDLILSYIEKRKAIKYVDKHSLEMLIKESELNSIKIDTLYEHLGYRVEKIETMSRYGLNGWEYKIRENKNEQDKI